MAVLIQQRINLVLILVKQKQSFAEAFITMVIIVICLLKENKFLSFKADKKNSNFPTQF